MSAADWFLAAWLLLGVTIVVGSVGKPRKPIEPHTAAVAVLINVALISWLLWSHGVTP